MKNKVVVMLIIIVMVLGWVGGYAQLINAEDAGTEILWIEGDYSRVEVFSEGLAVVSDGYPYKSGYIDRTGKVVVPLIYDRADNFSEGLAAVYKDGKSGYIDKTGKLVVPLIYYSYYYENSFSGGLAVVYRDGKYGYIDKTGKEVIPIIYDWAGEFNEGLARVKKDDYYGYIDKTGKVVIPIKYYSAEAFSEGLAAVKVDGQFGYIDKTGEMVIPNLDYDYGSNFSEGMAMVTKSGMSGYIDKTGKEIIPLIYKSATDFSEGLARVQKGTWYSGYIDKSGREIIPLKYYTFQNTLSDFSEGLAAVSRSDRGGGYGYIDKNGEEVIPLYSYGDINNFSEGMAAVTKGGRWGLISNPIKYNINEDKGETYTHLYDELDPGSSIILPHNDISKITNKETAVQTLSDTVKKLTQEQKQSPTGIDLITLFAEEALAQGSSTSIGGDNIEINSKTIAPLETIANQTKTEMDKTLTSQGITRAREISTGIKLKTESTKDLTIKIDKSILDTNVDKIIVESPNISVKIDREEIKEDIKNDPLIITIKEDTTLALEEIYEMASLNGIQIASKTKKTYTVNFNRAVKENITVSLPRLEGDTRYQAVIESDGNIVGGKYNPAKNTIDVKIKESGKYTVKENAKDFTDIKNKSKEMQEAIKVLASKGIIAGNTATTFDPDGSISRAEIAALIVRTLSKIDKDAKVIFKDIKANDWYYNIAGSSMKYGIINGYDDNTFRGRNQIKKDQIIAVAARTLRTEMKYKEPSNVDKYINMYKDKSKIATWAKPDISLATRENLVIKRVDGNFLGTDRMTRGDAAIIIKRLFDKIW